MDNQRSLYRRVMNAIFNNSEKNKFNEAFLQGIGGGLTLYDPTRIEYLEKGYNINSTVFSLINIMATKTSSVPYYIKDIEDKQAVKRLEMLEKATNFNMSTQQHIKSLELKEKAYSKSEKPFPMEKPNANQTWSEFISLYKTFLKLDGNVYIYILKPELRDDAEPVQVYLLPSQYMQIVVKNNVNFLGAEDPIDHYMLTYGKSYIDFKAENVIHIKYANPNYDENGAHLYGMSQLAAALRNIQSSNEAMDLNIKTLQNGGAFGFIHGKSIPLQVEQADEIKNRLKEMKADSGDLSKITAVSSELGFLRMSLTADELKPFEYLKWDAKQIANCLIWSDKLLNSDEGAKYDNVGKAEKWVIVNNIVPDLRLLEEALNDKFLPLFKGYENSCIKWDVMELPEMQVNMETLTAWLNGALDRGVLNREEYRTAINYSQTDLDEMKQFTVTTNTMNLKDALEDDLNMPQ